MNIDPIKVHRLKNQLAIILGFCELLLEEMPDGQPRSDLLQVQQAARTALAELPPLPAHEFSSTMDATGEVPVKINDPSRGIVLVVDDEPGYAASRGDAWPSSGAG